MSLLMNEVLFAQLAGVGDGSAVLRTGLLCSAWFGP